MAGAANGQQVQPVRIGAGTAQPGGNIFNQSAQLFNQAAAGPNIAQFMNPYTQNVVNRTGADMQRQMAMASNTLGANATAAGAFGGSRHGVAEGTMMGDALRGFGDTAANLNMTGFNQAVNNAQQQQGIQAGLAGQGFGFGQAINQQQAQAGAQQQALQQQLIDAARAQFGGFAGAPQNSIQGLIAALQGANFGQNSSTTTQRPGLFNIASLLLGGL